MLNDIKIGSVVGLLVAEVIMSLWVGSLLLLVSVDIVQWVPLYLLPVISGAPLSKLDCSSWLMTRSMELYYLATVD